MKLTCRHIAIATNAAPPLSYSMLIVVINPDRWCKVYVQSGYMYHDDIRKVFTDSVAEAFLSNVSVDERWLHLREIATPL